LPFNNHSFLYVRPLYVQAAGGSFPQLRYVIVGTQSRIAQGTNLPDALQNLFGQPIPLPGLGAPSGPSPSPGVSAPPPPGGTGVTLPPQVLAIVNDLIQHNTDAQQAIARGDYVTYGKEQDAVQKDLEKLRQLLGSGATVVPGPSASASPAVSPSPH
ncbi:MAG TPA: hypothetical protein VGF00_03735, partial [Acidimicrobiia bacterium]